MFSIRQLVRQIGNPIRAEAVLLQHYAVKQQARQQWNRRYAAMQFVVRWAPVFRRHLTGL